MSHPLTDPVRRTLEQRRRELLAVVVMVGLSAAVARRRRDRRRRRATLVTTSVAGRSADAGREVRPVSEFDRIEQERPAWAEPDDALPAEVPAGTPEADFLEQAREVPVDDEDERAG